MTTIDLDVTLGDLVTMHPELARELEQRHLDYCCGGGVTLADACATAGLDATRVVDELAAAADQPSVPEWSTLGASALAAHIVATHHRYLWDELPRLDALAVKVLSVHGERHLELATILETLRALRADLEPHLVKEERVLFPMITQLDRGDAPASFHCGSIENPIAVMLAEHDAAGELLDRLRELTGDYTPPADACASYTALFEGLRRLEEDTHEHVHKENHRLFPLAVELEAGVSARLR
jgi:regulator of cell morphogenesis and NO signaling